jgi:hypothetical protein
MVERRRNQLLKHGARQMSCQYFGLLRKRRETFEGLAVVFRAPADGKDVPIGSFQPIVHHDSTLYF